MSIAPLIPCRFSLQRQDHGVARRRVVEHPLDREALHAARTGRRLEVVLDLPDEVDEVVDEDGTHGAVDLDAAERCEQVVVAARECEVVGAAERDRRRRGDELAVTDGSRCCCRPASARR